MKYDTSLIKEEVRRQRAQQRRDDLWRTIQALYPLGCLLAALLFAALFSIGCAYCLFMWITSPSLYGTY